MFDIRPAKQRILFTQLSTPQESNAPQFPSTGDDITLRAGMLRVSVKIQHALDTKNFTGIIQEVELDEIYSSDPRKQDLRLGQLVEFSHDMIFACARDA